MKGPDFGKAGGLVPAVVQDWQDGTVLMMAWMNPRAWELTLHTGQAVYWSRSHQRLWHKGETSGNVQLVKDIYLDCDGDTVLLKVEQIGGAACHTGRRTCFHFRRDPDGGFTETGHPLFDPAEVYGEEGD